MKARGCNLFIFSDNEIKANVYIDNEIIDKINGLNSAKRTIKLIGIFDK